ncbi:Do family serine endopeptidase [Nitrospiraceae bacterium AH_259_D15_M11_P09]|nr:Do family serine endopeptidase [Nitrospiraceae bacterium AH_259_D15_M11_P09]
MHMKSRSLILPGRNQGPLLRIAVLVASLAALSTGLTISPVQAAVPPQLAQGFSGIVKQVMPAVVNIAVTGGERMAPGRRPLPPGPFGGPPGGGPPGMQPPSPAPPPPGGPRRPDLSAGSGVIIDASGYIVTNNHVVENASEITVTLGDRREFRATVVGTDPKTDLAVIKIEVDNLPALKWADYEALQVGDLVLAAGSPFGLTSTVTLGIISALGRGNMGITDYEDFIQTDAAINPGNSGGALVNMNGDLIGINTAIFSRTGGSEGIGFAIPSSIAVDIVDSLRRTGKVVRGWMGIAIQEVTPALAKSFKLKRPRGGVLISEVNESGPSAAAGLKRGDVIIGYDRKAIENVNQLRNLVARTHVGNKAEVKVIRDGKEEVLVIQIGERPPDELLVARRRPTPAPEPESAELPDNVLAALRVEALDAAMRSQLNLLDTTKGVVINHVEPGSSAEAAGLLRGDVVQEVNRRVIRDLDDYQKAASEIKKDDMVVLLLSRRGNNLFVAVNPE